jgi:hypothetical protein
VNAWAASAVKVRNQPAQYDYLGICDIDVTALVAKVNRVGVKFLEEYPPECWVRRHYEETE